MIPIEHIHPMLVHFPIVLFMSVLALDFIIVASGRDLADHGPLAGLALVILWLGVAAAAATAFFGDAALDIAAGRGFPQAALERHEGLGWTTLLVFAGIAALRLFAWWRRIPVRGGRGWLAASVTLAGVAVLVLTAYRGGELVYQLGVNVAAIKP
jgi:uncharacterized membrane protein